MDEAHLQAALQQIIEAYRDHEPEFPEVSIVARGIRHDDHWWYVPVYRHGPPTPRVYPFYDHLNALEALIRRELKVDVLFVPARAA